MGKDRKDKDRKIRKRNNSKKGIEKIRSKLEDVSLELENKASEFKNKTVKKDSKYMHDEMYDYDANKEIKMIISNKEFAPDRDISKAEEIKKEEPKLEDIQKELDIQFRKQERKIKAEKKAVTKSLKEVPKMDLKTLKKKVDKTSKVNKNNILKTAKKEHKVAQKAKVPKIKVQKVTKPKKTSTYNYSKLKTVCFMAAILFILGSTFLFFIDKADKARKTKMELARKEQIAEENALKKEKVKQEKIKAEELNEKLEYETNAESNVTCTFLGDIILPRFEKTTEDYSLPFKDISYMTAKADYTIAVLPSVITKAEIDEDTKSDYILPKEAISALKSLDINVVNLANNTILDYGEYMLRSTTDILKGYEIKNFGFIDNTIYLTKNKTTIALIAYNDIISGTRSNFESAKVSLYSKEACDRDVAEAKKNADIVIVNLHYGNTNKSKVTDQMKDSAKGAIDAGADLVVGSHALGVLPVEIYNGKPIVYGIGYLIADVKTEIAKQGATFDVNINEQRKIDKITINPIYIENNEVKKSTDVKLQQFLSRMGKSLDEYGTKYKILTDKIVINI